MGSFVWFFVGSFFGAATLYGVMRLSEAPVPELGDTDDAEMRHPHADEEYDPDLDEEYDSFRS